jgi:hypothetical protein
VLWVREGEPLHSGQRAEVGRQRWCVDARDRRPISQCLEEGPPPKPYEATSPSPALSQGGGLAAGRPPHYWSLLTEGSW